MQRSLNKSVLLIVLLVIAIAGGVWLIHKPQASSFPTAIMRHADFRPYYPTGVSIDRSSVQLINGGSLLSFTVSVHGRNVSVVQQPRPSSFDFSALAKQMTDQSQFLTSEGTATVGKFNGRTVGSLIAGDTWIFVSGPRNVPSDDVDLLLKQFTPVTQ